MTWIEPPPPPDGWRIRYFAVVCGKSPALLHSVKLTNGPPPGVEDAVGVLAFAEHADEVASRGSLKGKRLLVVALWKGEGWQAWPE